MAVRDITIGQMNKRITLAVPVTVKNDSYGLDTTYEDKVTVWAFARKLSGFRSVQANMAGLEITHEFFIRSSVITEAIDKNWLLRYDSKRYVIQDIEKMSERRELIKVVAAEREAWETNES